MGYIDKMLEITDTNSPSGINYMVKKAEVLQSAYSKTSDNIYLRRAIGVYESLLAEMPNNTSVLNNLAYMLAEENIRLDDAIEYAKRAYVAESDNPSFLDTYSYVLYKNGRYSEAAEFLHAALQEYERNKISAPWEVYEHLGQIYDKLGSRTETLAAFRQALEAGGEKLPEAAEERINAAIEQIGSEDKD